MRIARSNRAETARRGRGARFERARSHSRIRGSSDARVRRTRVCIFFMALQRQAGGGVVFDFAKREAWVRDAPRPRLAGRKRDAR